LVGLGACSLGAKVVMTDMKAVVGGLLTENLQKNIDKIKRRFCTCVDSSGNDDGGSGDGGGNGGSGDRGGNGGGGVGGDDSDGGDRATVAALDWLDDVSNQFPLPCHGSVEWQQGKRE